MELLLLMQRTNVRHQGLNLIIAERTLEGGHSALGTGDDLSEFRIWQFFGLLVIEDRERSCSFQPRNQNHLDRGTWRVSLSVGSFSFLRSNSLLFHLQNYR
jgi:hypothetical protein